MLMKIFSGVLTICFLVGSASADTFIEYTLHGDWIYEEEYEGTLTLSDNASGGITANINVPAFIPDGGLSASRHDLPGFSIDNNIFIELEYSSLTFNITGDTAELNLCLELEFFDSGFNRYEIGMSVGKINGLWSFATWFQDDYNFEYSYDEPIPPSLLINEGALGLYFHDNHVSAYFKDVENKLLYPFLDWDISKIVGAHGFRVDNDFEAYTENGGTVLASVNLKRVVYSPDAFVVDFSANPTWGSAPLIVIFTDQSTGSITSWEWDFGDGTSSTNQNPSHTYTEPGAYTVQLTVTGPGGSDTNIKANYIKVRPPAKAMPWIPLLLLDD